MNRPYRCAATIHPVRYCSGSISTRKARYPLLQREIGIFILRGRVAAQRRRRTFYEIIIKGGIRGQESMEMGFARAPDLHPGKPPGEGFAAQLGDSRIRGKKQSCWDFPFCLGFGRQGDRWRREFRSCLRCSGKYTPTNSGAGRPGFLSCSPGRGRPRAAQECKRSGSCPHPGLRPGERPSRFPLAALLLTQKPK